MLYFFKHTNWTQSKFGSILEMKEDGIKDETSDIALTKSPMHEFFLFCFGFWQDCLGCLNQNFILRKILSCLLIPVTEILILNGNRHILGVT